MHAAGTLHANSAADVPARVEALALAAGLGREAAHSQLASGVALVLHLLRGADGVRRLAEIAVPSRSPSGLVSMSLAVSFTTAGELVEAPAVAFLDDHAVQPGVELIQAQDALRLAKDIHGYLETRQFTHAHGRKARVARGGANGVL